MLNEMPYCPLVERCPHFPIKTEYNTCFLIEPWDQLRETRKILINNALKQEFLLRICDEKQGMGLFCDICQKIQKSAFCIADLSPKKVDLEENDKQIERLFIRPTKLLANFSFQFPQKSFFH
jgi:hypothetical protein